MSTAILDIQKSKLADIQNVVTAISNTRPEAPSPYINTHHFSPGIYIRAFYGVKGSVVVSQIHLHEHMTILAAGHCRVISTMQDEERIDVYKDFAIINTPAYTKRALYFLKNTLQNERHHKKYANYVSKCIFDALRDRRHDKIL